MTIKRTTLLAGLAAACALAAAGGAARGATSDCPTANNPNELVLVGGSGQVAQLGKPYGQNLQVKLANTNGCPLTGNLAGIYVTFQAPGSGASGVFAGTGASYAVVGTDSQGVATAPTFTANDTAGGYDVFARSDYGSVPLFLNNTAGGLPAAISAAGGSGQEATVNGAYAQPLQARVTDAAGNSVQGATVAFSVAPGPTGASAAFAGGQATATTDSNGLATSPPLLANATPGPFTATASAAGLSAVATYALDNHASASTAAIEPVSNNPAKATVHARYANPLQARVLDANGRPLEGASVTFAVDAAANGAGADFVGGAAQATALTDATGTATAPQLVANKTAGAFTVTATVAGAKPISYALENTAAAPAAVTAGAASGQSTTVGTRFPIPLAVTVADKDGNLVAGATVRFAAPAHGPSGRFGRSLRVDVKTNAKGVAVAPAFVANRSSGGYAVTAAVQGSALRAAFSLLNLP